ncbi:unnamed protein product [Aphanomyces euteiches]
MPIPAKAVGCTTCSLRRLTNTPPPPPRLPFHGERRPARVGSTADDSPPLPNDASKGCPSPAPFCSVRRLTNKTPPPPRLPLQGERRQARVVSKAGDSPTFPDDATKGCPSSFALGRAAAKPPRSSRLHTSFTSRQASGAPITSSPLKVVSVLGAPRHHPSRASAQQHGLSFTARLA